MRIFLLGVLLLQLVFVVVIWIRDLFNCVELMHVDAFASAFVVIR